jgi:peptidoglycan/LPS O-acetylase OafA/YrhL
MQTLKPRLLFIDNLRTFAIILVLLVHIALTYGASGLWYYKEGHLTGPIYYASLAFTCTCQAFFMGILFLLSGYFTPASYDRKGPGQFTLDRLTRLWLPVGIFVFLIDPFMQYALISAGQWPSPTGLPITLQDLPGLFINPFNGLGFGPLWFIEALFFFSLIYVVWRLAIKTPSKARPVPSSLTFALLAVGLGAASFLVRIWLPVGYVLYPFGFQLPFFPQYIAFFIVGMVALRGNWFSNLPAKTGMLWLRLAAVLLAVFLGMLTFAALTGTAGLYFGGLTWQAAFFAFWEQAFAVSVSVGLIVWFREKFNYQNRFAKVLSDNSYAAYFLQAPVLVGLALALATIQMPLALKFLAVAPIGVALCFVLAYLVRKIPKVSRVL